MMLLEKFTLILLVIFSSYQTGRCQEDGNILDRIVRIVWDPTGLVYIWTGLDQFFNVVRSWREVAVNLLTLPFRQQGKFGDHIKINGRTRALGQIKRRPVMPFHLNRASSGARKPVPFHHAGHPFPAPPPSASSYRGNIMTLPNPKNSPHYRPHIPLDKFVNANQLYGDWTRESKLKFNHKKSKRTFHFGNGIPPSQHATRHSQDIELQQVLLDMIAQQDGGMALTQPQEKLKTLLYLLKELKPDIEGIHGSLNS